MNAKRETVIGCGLMLGVALIVFGYFAGSLLLAGGAARMANTQGRDTSMMLAMAVGPILMGFGLLLVALSIFYGFATINRSKKGPIVNYPEVVVVARFAVNEAGEMVFQDFDPDDPDTKLYVHLRLPDGKNQEYRCPWVVFEACGEGMRGSAVIQGDWLGGFAPYFVQQGGPYP